MERRFRGFKTSRMSRLLEKMGEKLRGLRVEKTDARLPLPDFDFETRQVQPPTPTELDRLPDEFRKPLESIYGQDPRKSSNAIWRLGILFKDGLMPNRERLLPHVESIMPHLIQAMARHQDGRWAVYHAVERFPSAVRPHLHMLIPRLESDLSSENVHTRIVAVETVRKLATDAYKSDLMRLRPLIPALAERLNDENTQQSTTAGESLSEIARRKPSLIQTHADAILPDLERALDNQFLDTRRGAMDALNALGPKAMPQLVTALRQPHMVNWHEAAQSITAWLEQGYHPELREDVIRSLEEHIQPQGSNISPVPGTAIRALTQLEKQGAVPFLSAQLRHQQEPEHANWEYEKNYRRDLVSALHSLGSATVPHLIDAMQKERNTDLKANLAQTIGQQFEKKDAMLERHFEAAIKALVPLLAHNAWDVKDKAQKALASMQTNWAAELETHNEALAFALKHISPATHPKAFMTLWEDRHDPDYSVFTERDWQLHIKHLKADETALKAA